MLGSGEGDDITTPASEKGEADSEAGQRSSGRGEGKKRRKSSKHVSSVPTICVEDTRLGEHGGGGKSGKKKHRTKSKGKIEAAAEEGDNKSSSVHKRKKSKRERGRHLEVVGERRK